MRSWPALVPDGRHFFGETGVSDRVPNARVRLRQIGHAEWNKIMVTYRIMRWQEIPSAVEVRDESGVSKQQLSNRFQVLIDHAAMRRGLSDSDAYMEQWNMSEAEARTGSATEVLAQLISEIEEAFPQFRDNVNKLQRS